MNRFSTFITIACLFAFASIAAAEAKQAAEAARNAKQILSAKCMKCHGPSKASGGIAFDTRERALAKTESGEIAISPGKPEASELLTRVTSTDETTRMPPEGKPLTAAEVEVLRTWIREGAEWSQHWAFRKLEKPALPEVQNKGWTKNEIDAFILAGLEHAKLQPAQPADKLTLVRRAYFNLTGLPPTPEEVDSFLNDNSPNAWEKLIDKLLASERYGEHWGRKWLDVVRFAETNSFERDGAKPHAWRYRDYVIRAFNEDKPYDVFLKEQLAGDEQPNPTAEALIASGFYRLGVWDDEPADRELATYDGLDDIVSTIGQGMLGLTMGCARCHNHKIDPIPQADYYKLVAFVRNLIPMASNGPNIEQELFSNQEKKAAHEAAVKKQQEEANQVQLEISTIEDKFLKLYQEESEATAKSDIDDLEYRYYRDSWQKLPDFDNLKPETVGKIESGFFDTSLTTRDTAFGFVFLGKLKVPQDGKYIFMLNSDDGARLSLNGKQVIINDGIHGDEAQVTAEVELKAGLVPIRVDYFQNVHGRGLTIAWRGAAFRKRLLTKPTNERAKQPKNQLAELIKREGKAVLGEETLNRYAALNKTLVGLKAEPPIEKALVAKERDSFTPDVFILLRGTPGNHGEKVMPGFPKIFETPDPAVPKPSQEVKSSGRRTILANWVASPENRLTARVMVNRLWQGQFGRGIVRSANNFGGLGTPPTHPELLDWLASDFMANGWKMKRLQKLMMMSSAYQMSSHASDAGLAKDPANDHYWRFDMRRLSAEEVRDSMLAITGKLNLKMYGPSIYPTIQAEVLAGQSIPGNGWKTSPPEEQTRRSVYIHVKRSLITPLLASFDFPETDSSCEARFTTTQPGQSFAMLNGKFANDQAADFVKRLDNAELTEKKTGPAEDLRSEIKRAYKLTLGREPKPAETVRAQQLIAKLEKDFALSRELAMEQFCLYMLNLNEFTYLD